MPPVVVRNDELSWAELRRRGFDNIVISPGPGRPERADDFGICRDVIEQAEIPVLGVCLGHQGLGYFCGARVDYAQEVMHGRISSIHHSKTELFKDIPSPFDVVRYHSLVITDLPEQLEVSAFTTDNTVMAIRHKTRPMWGVQFHPESICSEYGYQLVQNFQDLTVAWYKQNPPTDESRALPNAPPPAPHGVGLNNPRVDSSKMRLFHRRLPYFVEPGDVFEKHFGGSAKSFWLDSSLIAGGARFSFMGDNSGPFSELVSYKVQAGETRIERMGAVERYPGSVFDYLDAQLKQFDSFDADFPFDFNLGYVGYFGYEMKAECGYPENHVADTPDAMWLLADRALVFDHLEEVIYLLVMDTITSQPRAEAWMSRCEDELQRVLAVASKAPHQDQEVLTDPISMNSFERALNEREYLERITQAKQFIHEGETYEVCLTNKLKKSTQVDALKTYQILRASNPAPYSGYLKFSDDLTVLCASPERFLAINRHGVVETKPIKGTRKRGASALEDEALISDLRTSEKDRAENLMIVDLLRNDLGRVSEIGSVQVTKLFDVETYATVHQLVSTIRSHLKRNTTALGCVRACFPGGSMTGAPKKRTLDILGRLEAEARGIYSGTIGYLAFNGCADLNIVIRTLVMHRGVAEVGVGGAIVDLSDPEQELQETLLKSEALIAAVLAAEQKGKR